MSPNVQSQVTRLISEEIHLAGGCVHEALPGDAPYRPYNAAVALLRLSRDYKHSEQNKRALALLFIANRLAPSHVGVLRALTDAFFEQENGDRAYRALARIERIQGRSRRLSRLQNQALSMARGRRDSAGVRQASAQDPATEK